MRYDVSAASLVDDDGKPIAADQVQPGMTTEIDSTVVRLTPTGATATASLIRTTTRTAPVRSPRWIAARGC